MKILFAGEGGQGVQVIAEILAKAAFYDKKHSSYIPNFGVEQRGGVSLAFVIIQDKDPVGYPKFDKADILAVLSNRSLTRVEDYIGSKTTVIYGPSVTLRNPKNTRKVLKLKEESLPAKVWNMLVLGKIIKTKNIVSNESVRKAVEERFGKYFKKDLSLKELDFRALDL
ncbi:MAG: 2-oxoacid:acceptor oxidoreductase family protein [Patescibacteria group bacterium]|nr:2-oxoacid:acceptor oxidoreductase family protein [Patescibacteria group bacterium]